MNKERETRLCKQCYEPIDVRAKVCPHCRRTTGKGLASRFKWKLVEIVFAALAVVVIYFAIQWATGDMARRLGEQARKSRPAPVRSHAPSRR